MVSVKKIKEDSNRQQNQQHQQQKRTEGPGKKKDSQRDATQSKERDQAMVLD